MKQQTQGYPRNGTARVMPGYNGVDIDTRVTNGQFIGYQSFDVFFGGGAAGLDRPYEYSFDIAGKALICQSLQRSEYHSNKGLVDFTSAGFAGVYSFYFNDQRTPFGQFDARQFNVTNSDIFHAHQPQYSLMGFPFRSIRVVRLDNPIASNDTGLRITILEEPFQSGFTLPFMSFSTSLSGGGTAGGTAPGTFSQAGGSVGGGGPGDP